MRRGSFWLSPIGFLGHFGRQSSETLGFPGKRRKRHAETTEPSGKSGIKRLPGRGRNTRAGQCFGRRGRRGCSGVARRPGACPPDWRLAGVVGAHPARHPHLSRTWQVSPSGATQTGPALPERGRPVPRVFLLRRRRAPLGHPHTPLLLQQSGPTGPQTPLTRGTPWAGSANAPAHRALAGPGVRPTPRLAPVVAGAAVTRLTLGATPDLVALSDAWAALPPPILQAIL